MINISTISSVGGSILGLAVFIFGAFKLKAYIEETIKKGTNEAANQAVNNWQQVADSQKARMEEMKVSIDDLTSKVKILSEEKVVLTDKVDKLQKTIESMIGVDGVGKMLESAIPHFEARITELVTKQDLIISLLQGKDTKKGDNIVNVTTK